jgi:putative intracellular protease/amidase
MQMRKVPIPRATRAEDAIGQLENSKKIEDVQVALSACCFALVRRLESTLTEVAQPHPTALPVNLPNSMHALHNPLCTFSTCRGVRENVDQFDGIYIPGGHGAMVRRTSD